MSYFLRGINWTNLLFLVVTPLVGIIGTLCIILTSHLVGLTLILALIFITITGLAITAGYHRLFSHNSYQASWPVRLFFVLVGAAAFEGSVLEWCTDHRNHHRYTDTDRDPYNIKQGFWHAHIGWLFYLDTSLRDYSNVTDLTTDPLICWQHRFFKIIAVVMGFLLPMVIASLWGDPWGGLIIAGALRIAFNQQCTFCINSVCHYFGKKTFSEQQSARDHWVTAVFTFGEGFHNFHHQFPIDYRNGVRVYHYDPSKWLIRILAYLGLAQGLKKVSKEQIIRYRIRRDEHQMLSVAEQRSELFLNSQASIFQTFDPFIQPLRERILQIAGHIEQLEKDYHLMKKEKIQYIKGKMSEYRPRLENQRMRLKKARLELKNSLGIWGEIVRYYTKLGSNINNCPEGIIE